MDPLVSICIPTYNNISGLSRLLKSIAIQSFVNYEIIITDDSTNEDISNYILALRNNKIRYIKNSHPYGPPENWNYSISLASGKYIKIMHHDDWFTNKDSLFKFVNVIEKSPNCPFVFSGSRQYNLLTNLFYDRSITNEQIKLINKDVRYLITGNFIGAPSATMFKQNSIRFDNHLKWLVDIDFYIEYLKNNNNFISIIEPLVSIGISDSQVTNSCINNKELLSFEFAYEIRKHSIFYNWKIRKFSCNNLFKLGMNRDSFKKNGFSSFDYFYALIYTQIESLSELIGRMARKVFKLIGKRKCI